MRLRGQATIASVEVSTPSGSGSLAIHIGINQMGATPETMMNNLDQKACSGPPEWTRNTVWTTQTGLRIQYIRVCHRVHQVSQLAGRQFGIDAALICRSGCHALRIRVRQITARTMKLPSTMRLTLPSR